MYSPIKDHKSHVWLTENTSTHRASALAFFNSDIRAGAAVSFGGKTDALQGWKLSLCSVNTESIIGINNAVSILLQTYTRLLSWEKFHIRKGMKSTISGFITSRESQWLMTNFTATPNWVFLRQDVQKNPNHLVPLKQIGCTITMWVHISWREKLNTSR